MKRNGIKFHFKSRIAKLTFECKINDALMKPFQKANTLDKRFYSKEK